MGMSRYEALREALNIILEHKEELDAMLFEGIHYKVLGIKKGDSSKENLKKWFILATGPGWRGGPSPRLEERIKMLEQFDEWYDDVVTRVLPNYQGQRAMDEVYKGLMKIKRVGPKIAGVYLKDIIYHFGAWPSLVEYLYLPIDRHVRNLMVNKLCVFDEDEVPKVGESYFTRRNQRFQRLLDNIHRPRVEFDYLWAIGAMFCAYHLCDFCWIRHLCKNRLPI